MNKHFTIKDVCTLPSLNGIILLNGHEHTDRIINHVNVMEVPDVENWVQEDELLMTTGYMFRDNPDQLAAIIPKLVEHKVAALGIKPRRFLDTIPLSVINAAEKYGLPLLLLPDQTSFSLVIRESMEQILTSEKENRAVFIKNLLLGEYPNESTILNHAKQNDINISPATHFTLFVAVEYNDHSISEKEHIYQSFRGFCKTQGIECHHIIYNNHIVMLLLHERLLKDSFFNQFEELANIVSVHLCLNAENVSLMDLAQEYKNVLSIVDITSLANPAQGLIRLKDLGLYAVLPHISETMFASFYTEHYILPLKQYDLEHSSNLFETMLCYFKNDCNMKLTAENLYTHYNTIVYRITQIQELLNVNLHSFKQQCALYLTALLNDNGHS